MADENVTPDLPGVAAPENAVIGDDGLEVREATVEVVKEDQPAQVTGPPAKPVDTVRVHEVSIVLDEVITDPSHPLAVQVPDAGRGSLDLPIHALSGQTVEEFFIDSAPKVEEADNDEPVNPAASE